MDTPRTVYERWLDGEYTNPGGFEQKIFEAYQHAGDTNKDKLKKAYPEYFTMVLHDTGVKIESPIPPPSPDPIQKYYKLLQKLTGENTSDLEDLQNLHDAAMKWVDYLKEDIQDHKDHAAWVKDADAYLEHIHQAIALGDKLGLIKDVSTLKPLERDLHP